MSDNREKFPTNGFLGGAPPPSPHWIRPCPSLVVVVKPRCILTDAYFILTTAQLKPLRNVWRLVSRSSVKPLLLGSRNLCMTSARRQQSDEISQQSQELPRLVDCRQGSKVVPTFSKDEMQSRLDKLRSFMGDSGIEACVLTSYHNINYFSDFLFCYFGRPYAVVITPEDLTVVGASKYLLSILAL